MSFPEIFRGSAVFAPFARDKVLAKYAEGAKKEERQKVSALLFSAALRSLRSLREIRFSQSTQRAQRRKKDGKCPFLKFSEALRSLRPLRSLREIRFSQSTQRAQTRKKDRKCPLSYFQRLCDLCALCGLCETDFNKMGSRLFPIMSIYNNR
ncbi:MAG: hypothetical protein BWK80_22950 [Desulfobacteraceae bacterium IS3]|nr:MAG: hypothetical protein BWK80_22950 [Desulfobacteraceae bacterium IS3]